MKKTWLICSILALLTALTLAGCLGRWLAASGSLTSVEPRKAVTLFAAASTGPALEEIVAGFHRAHQITVETNFASSSTLAQQIANGAGADVFLSANEAWVDYLEDGGLVARREDLLGNRLVVVLPAASPSDVHKPEDLLGDAIRHVALADPEAVPVGIYARQAMTKLGLWEALKPKVVVAADVRQALAFVETGAAEAGIVYATDAASSDRVLVAARIDPDLTGPIRYPMALLTAAKDRPEVELFYGYLTSPAAAEVFQKYGFTVEKRIRD